MVSASRQDHPAEQPALAGPRPQRWPGAARDWPVPLTPFVGREREVEQVTTLLRRADVRLLTLTGPGGVGKTRLALAVAAAKADELPDGITFVRLAPVRDPELVLPTVAQTLGVQDVGDEPIAERLHTFLTSKNLLLVLDNFEHVVEAAPEVADLIAACPQLTVLITSRVRLQLTGEREYVVPPLSLPTTTSSVPSEAHDAEAVRLFAERARAIKADFALTDENVAAVTEICRRLDGLPLAIELAAARIKVLPLRALVARLERRLPLLSGGTRDQPARLRTMRDAIAWSYDLLEPREQVLFRRLAVFVGGFTLEAAEAIVAALDSESAAPGEWFATFDILSVLVDQSLLRLDEGPDDVPRYRMLETIREYGLEQLQASGEAEVVRRQHMECFTSFADAVGTNSLWQPDPSAAFVRLDADRANLRAALAWAAACGETVTLLRLAVGLQWYWQFYGGLREGRVWLDRVAALADEAPAPLRAAVLIADAWLARWQGDHQCAELLAERSRFLFREQGNIVGESETLAVLGLVAEDRGEFARSRALREESLRLLQPLTEPIRTGWAMWHAGYAALICGDIPAAERLMAEALALFGREGSAHGTAYALCIFGNIAQQRGEYARAAGLWKARLNLTWNVWDLRFSLEALGEIAVACRQMERAARLFGAAEAVRERLGVIMVPSQRPPYEASVATTRAALGEAAFATAWAEGRRMSPEEARAEAAKVAQAPAEAAASPDRHGVTPRELEVLRLLAAGHSDREIGAALFISHRTVMRHVTGILTKLGVENRTAAAHYAHQHNLL